MSLTFLAVGEPAGTASSAGAPGSSTAAYPPSVTSHPSVSMGSLNGVPEPRSPQYGSETSGRRPSIDTRTIDSRTTRSSGGDRAERDTGETYGGIVSPDDLMFKPSRSGSQPAVSLSRPTSPPTSLTAGSRLSTGSGNKTPMYSMPHTTSQPDLLRPTSPTTTSSTLPQQLHNKRTSVSSGHSGGPGSVKSFDSIKFQNNMRASSNGSLEMGSSSTSKLSKFFGEETSKLSIPAYEVGSILRGYY